MMWMSLFWFDGGSLRVVADGKCFGLLGFGLIIMRGAGSSHPTSYLYEKETVEVD